MGFNNIGKALAALRRQRRLTQSQLAALCGVGSSQVSRYEAGKQQMKLAPPEKLLASLAVEPADFFRLLRPTPSALPLASPPRSSRPLAPTTRSSKKRRAGGTSIKVPPARRGTRMAPARASRRPVPGPPAPAPT